MSDLDEMARRHDETLDELARMGMELAESLEARFGRCDSLAELESLVRAYDRAARDVRETLALKAQLRRRHAAAKLADQLHAAGRSGGARPSRPQLH